MCSLISIVPIFFPFQTPQCHAGYLKIIPRDRMGSESIAHEAFGFRVHVGERNDCFSKIQLVGQNYRE